MKGKKFLSSLAILAGVLGAGAAVQAQEKPVDTAPVVGDSIDVRVVNVEVVVTDRLGKRVKDLKPGDFRLKVDGKPVPIEYFTEVRDGRAAAPAGSGETAAAPLPGVEPGEPIGTNYLVFIDGLFSVAQQRNVVLTHLKKELDRMAPGDRMSVVAWDGGRLARIAGWTGSREELSSALDLAMRMPSRGLERRVELKRLLSDLQDMQQLQTTSAAADGSDDLARILGPGPGMNLTEIAYGQALGFQIAGASHAVISTLRGSASPPGRKVLLLLSGGWPFSLESYVRGNRPIALDRELPETQSALRELSDTANLLGYTIYPIDVPGLGSPVGEITTNPLEGQGSFLGGSVNSQARVDLGSSNAIPLPAIYTNSDTFREQEIEGTLLYLAKETGGKPLLNGNRETVLARASDDTRSYYWFGFTPIWQRDGKSHRVSVEMTQRGLRARSRQGFLDLTRGAEAGMKVESALLFGDLPEGAPLTLHLGEPVQGAQRGVVEIPLTVDIPAEAVTVLPEQGQYAAVAQLRLIATDERGKQSTLPVLRIRLTSPKAPRAGETLRYSTKVFLHGRADQLVAAVYDPVTGNVAAGKAEIRLP